MTEKRQTFGGAPLPFSDADAAKFHGAMWGRPKWVTNWKEFREAGGITNYNEDQTQVTLTLPEGYKFAIRFNQEA